MTILQKYNTPSLPQLDGGDPIFWRNQLSLISKSINQLVAKMIPFGASGATHSSGLVPDPGGAAGTTRFLAEDATFKALSNATLAAMPANTIKGNNTGGSTTPSDLTVAQTQTLLGVGSQMPGTTTNDNASAGNVGEYIDALQSFPGPSITSNTPTSIASISLTAGDWDVNGCIIFSGNGTTTVTTTQASLSTVNNTMDGSFMRKSILPYNGETALASDVPSLFVGPSRFSLSSTTTVYIVAQIVFGVSTANACGLIRARRVR
jgi:hypothetical protein